MRTGGREASEFPSCFEGGDAGEDADARRQIEHPRRDNIITGCFRVRSFFSPREEHAIPSASIGRVKNYHSALLPLLPFRRSETKAIEIKSEEEIRRLNRCV